MAKKRSTKSTRKRKVSPTRSPQRKPRLLWANPTCLLDTSSGAAISIREMLYQLAEHGYEVAVVGATIFDADKGNTRLKEHWDTIQEATDSVVNITDGPLLHRLVKTNSHRRQQMSSEEERIWLGLYYSMLEQFKPDLVWYYGGFPLELLIPYEARMRGIPSAAYLVNGNYTDRRWCHDTDLLITDTQATADFYAKDYGFSPEPVGKFINPDRVVASTHTPQYITFINPSYAKGAGIVVLMALMLEDRRPDIVFEVVESRGNWHRIVQQVTGTLGDPRESLSNVIVTPNTDDMREIYGRSRILLAPSQWWESGARVLAEAMLNGIPAIVTTYGGSKELIQDAGFAIKLPDKCHEKPYTSLPKTEDLQPLVKQIERLFDDEPFYQQLAARAIEVGERHHRLEISTERLKRTLTPFTRQLAGDQAHQTLMEATHKHPIKKVSKHNNQRQEKQTKTPKSTTRDPYKEDDFQENVIKTFSERAAPKETLKLGEKGIFIDCGGYDGCSSIKFKLNNQDFDCVTFEPNPVLWPYYEKLPVRLIKKAAYIYTGKIDFTLDNLDEDGSSLVKEKKIDFTGQIKNSQFPKIQSECVDISEYIKDCKKKYDKVILKMDIEGAEYDILELLIKKGSINYIDKLYCEFHWHKCGITKERHDEIVNEVTKSTPVFDWDALDFSIHKRSNKHKKARDILLSNFFPKEEKQKQTHAELIFHIGMHRTGTTTLQEHFFPNFQGYLGRCKKLHGGWGYDECSKLLIAAASISKEGSLSRFFECLDKKQDSLQSKNLILSNEALIEPLEWKTAPFTADGSVMDSKPETPILSLLEKIKNEWPKPIKVIFIVRRQPEWLASHYSRVSSAIASASQDDFEKQTHNILNNNIEWIDWSIWLNKLTGILGDKNVLCLPMEMMSDNLYWERLSEFLGQEKPSNLNFKKHRENQFSLGNNFYRIENCKTQNDPQRSREFELQQKIVESILNNKTLHKSNKELELRLDLNLRELGYYH